MCVVNRKPKFKDPKNCLKATQRQNKIKKLEKNKVNTESLRENRNEFIKNKKLISKGLKAKDIIFLLKKLTKIALSANYDKRIQLIDSVEMMHMKRARI